MNPTSPLRYPGGKGCLVGLLSDVIDLNNLRGCAYFEPYAGGAGAALELLRKETVSEVFINDADFRVGAFWESVLGKTERFVDEIFRVPLSIEEWRRQQSVCANPEKHTRFQAGFAAFYMNRCNRSGVLTGAGPIGGYAQTGKWKLGVRFNREALAERVLVLGRMRDRIHVSNGDALEFYLPPFLVVMRASEFSSIWTHPTLTRDNGFILTPTKPAITQRWPVTSRGRLFFRGSCPTMIPISCDNST